jgi:oligoribonuclease NrnB/cAMP/cGMP phosphodiesterase (DHH superfamily)|tara:strand:- start:453 stop:656 length:204 start_codon:yes stop_codon:yes gene_type:complete
MSNEELMFRTFKKSTKEKFEEEADEYADVVASSGSPVSYKEAYEYFMKTRYYDNLPSRASQGMLKND